MMKIQCSVRIFSFDFRYLLALQFCPGDALACWPHPPRRRRSGLAPQSAQNEAALKQLTPQAKGCARVVWSHREPWKTVSRGSRRKQLKPPVPRRGKLGLISR